MSNLKINEERKKKYKGLRLESFNKIEKNPYPSIKAINIRNTNINKSKLKINLSKLYNLKSEKIKRKSNKNKNQNILIYSNNSNKENDFINVSSLNSKYKHKELIKNKNKISNQAIIERMKKEFNLLESTTNIINKKYLSPSRSKRNFRINLNNKNNKQMNMKKYTFINDFNSQFKKNINEDKRNSLSKYKKYDFPLIKDESKQNYLNENINNNEDSNKLFGSKITKKFEIMNKRKEFIEMNKKRYFELIKEKKLKNDLKNQKERYKLLYEKKHIINMVKILKNNYIKKENKEDEYKIKYNK